MDTQPKNHTNTQIPPKEETEDSTWTSCRIGYAEFKERLRNAPPPPKSIPDYEAAVRWRKNRMQSKY